MSRASDLANLIASGNTTIHGEAGVTSSDSTGKTTNLQQGLAKCSIKFDGASATASEDLTGVSYSFNVTSLVDVSTGRYKININNDMTDGDYAISHAVSPTSGGGSDLAPMIDSTNVPAAGSFGVMAVRASFADPAIVCSLVHGDLA